MKLQVDLKSIDNTESSGEAIEKLIVFGSNNRFITVSKTYGTLKIWDLELFSIVQVMEIPSMRFNNVRIFPCLQFNYFVVATFIRTSRYSYNESSGLFNLSSFVTHATNPVKQIQLNLLTSISDIVIIVG